MQKQPFPFYQVKRIFLAAPGDLVSERSKFPKLIATVNDLRAHSLGFHLEAVGWERVIPSFGRPQELINRELELADLAVVLFWNRIGSPASKASSKTGTIEEFELARRLYAQVNRPLVWVYFRKPTAEGGDQLSAVLAHRRSIEEEKDLFFREYESLEDWEEMFRQHLVAYLDGLQRWDVDANVRSMRPEHALMKGSFLGEGIYAYGTVLRLSADLDGDGNAEEVGFKYSHGGFSLWVRKFDKKFALELRDWWRHGELVEPKTIHLAIKDVTNDGLPEILLATHDGVIDLAVAVYGFNSPEARADHTLDSTRFSLPQVLSGGQREAHVFDGGTIVLPYGSGGHAWTCKWDGQRFEGAD
jgi:hypothetical protein